MPEHRHAPEIDRIRRMLHPDGGRATITISNTRGGHATFRLKKATKGNWAGTIFADVQDERAQWGWRSVGKVDAASGFLVPYRDTTRELSYAIQLVLEALARHEEPEFLTDTKGGPYTVQAANACGMCGRPLTHPDSIPVGIGPECAQKSGAFHPGYSSTHVRTGGTK